VVAVVDHLGRRVVVVGHHWNSVVSAEAVGDGTQRCFEEANHQQTGVDKMASEARNPSPSLLTATLE
jgi:hypothetical protein